MKTVYLIADGMGGWPLEELGGKTTMEAAVTPNMDELARTGIVGRAQTVPEGMQPGSDVANMALLGFDPATYHTGRGPIEAAAQGLELDPDDLVWRLNLVTVSKLNIDGYMRDYSSGHISTEISRPVVEALQERLGNDTYTFIPGIQYRHLLVQKGGALTDDAKLNVNPPHDITDKPIKLDLRVFSRSPFLWDLIFEAKEILEDRDVNMSIANSIWPWGQGRPLNLPNFKETFGLDGAVISAVDLIKGSALHPAWKSLMWKAQPACLKRIMKAKSMPLWTTSRTTTSYLSTLKARMNADMAATPAKRSRQSAVLTPESSLPCVKRSRTKR